MQLKKTTYVYAIAAFLSSGVHAATIASTNDNHDFANAMLIPNGFFTTILNDAIELSDVMPNASVVAFSSGPYDYYTFTTSNAGSIFLDIDYTYTWAGNPGSFDPEVALWAAAGTLLGQNDDRGYVDTGSVHGWDSYLKVDGLSAGTYVVGVARYPASAIDGGWDSSGSEPIPSGSFYTLNISTPAPEPETWAMLLAGLGVVAAAARRKP